MSSRADAGPRAKPDTWEVRPGRTASEVVVVFRGHIDEQSGTAAAHALVDMFPKGGLDLVFDVVEVVAYQARARHAWQRELWPRRGLIRSLTVISDSSLTSMGAKVFSLVLGIPCTIIAASDREQALGVADAERSG